MAKIPNRALALRALLKGITHQRFRELNEIWYQLFQVSQKTENRLIRNRLKAGAVVQFAARQGGTVHGVIERVMKTRAVCAELTAEGRRIPGRTWRVSLTMLKPSNRKLSQTTSE